MIPPEALDENLVYFHQICSSQKCANWVAKMVNATCICQFTRGCKLGGKCGIYHLCP